MAPRGHTSMQLKHETQRLLSMEGIVPLPLMQMLAALQFFSHKWQLTHLDVSIIGARKENFET